MEPIMKHIIGIRKEDKNKWERRIPLVPADITDIHANSGVQFKVQSSPTRFFADAAFKKAGAEVVDHLDDCPIILAVKEIPQRLFREGGTYMFFSHTVKGQPYNMEMLRNLLDLKCNLIDYERIVDADGRRLIFFGRHAGLAGMIDTLWGLGQRLIHEGHHDHPLAEIKLSYQYTNLAEAKEHFQQIAQQIRDRGLSFTQGPLVIGFTGYGNVSAGAQEMLECLPVKTIEPEALSSFMAGKTFTDNTIYKVIFREEHLVKPVDEASSFDLQEYYTHPQRYCSNFASYLPHLTVLMNCIYWDTPYPRLLTNTYLKNNYQKETFRLKAIGDISCDINGAVECTVKATSPDNPVFVYEPSSEQIVDGVKGDGPLVMAVDNLPCEFPGEASEGFSSALAPFIPALAQANYTVPFAQLDLPPEIKGAMLVYQGKFTPDYKFMEKFINQ